MASGFIPRSLEAISRAIRGDLRRELPGTDAMVWPNTLSVFSKVVAMAIQLVEYRAEFIYRQIFASTADRRHLERQAFEFGMARKPASRATGRIVTTGTPDAIYPAGIGFLSDDVMYRSSGEARAMPDGTLFVLVHSEDAGAHTNREIDDELQLADPALFPSLGQTAHVDYAGLGGGADMESDESLRARILDRKRRPPQGGAYSDYERMVADIPGVAKAWAWPFAGGPGTVGVWFLFEGRENLIPTDADIAVVRDEIDARRLIRAGLFVNAPRPEPLDITIAGLGLDTVEVRSRIEGDLRAMLLERARPGVAAEAFVLSRSWISEAISGAIGESRHRLISPLDDVTYTDGGYPVLGTVTYE
ncbi:baseplate J/gp47 family protein [Mesorhizobium sp. KR2-14]|uniref:baseplate J/gp47 family protein n=1 Tax=Mesorhizobium sp. KR2-14 TaxID=3156610 RepID=UPI0032B5ECA3